MVYNILELLFWMAVATLGIIISFYGLYLVAVEDPWDMVWTTAGFGLDNITKIRYIITMKGTKHILKIVFIIISFVSITACSVPFANGMNGKDIIKIANAGKNIKNITKEGINEELITETKNILKDIQYGGKAQR